jgi:hypothetical protein
MLKHKLFAACVVVCSLTPCFFAQPIAPADLPAGEMQKKARTACTTCHESRIIVQQRLSKTAWAKEVDKMVKWGAILNASDRDALIDYFSVNFPPEKAPYTAPRSARAKH